MDGLTESGSSGSFGRALRTPAEDWDYDRFYHETGGYPTRARHIAALYRALLGRYPPPARGWALDLGCGTGAYAFELARRFGFRVVGVDRSLAALSQARTAYDASVSWLCGDGLDLPFRDQFDLVFCGDFDPYSQAADNWAGSKVTERLACWLHPGGRLIFKSASYLDDSRRGQLHWRQFSRASLRRMLDSPLTRVEGTWAIHNLLLPVLGSLTFTSPVSRLVELGVRIHGRRALVIGVATRVPS